MRGMELWLSRPCRWRRQSGAGRSAKGPGTGRVHGLDDYGPALRATTLDPYSLGSVGSQAARGNFSGIGGHHPIYFPHIPALAGMPVGLTIVSEFCTAMALMLP